MRSRVLLAAALALPALLAGCSDHERRDDRGRYPDRYDDRRTSDVRNRDVGYDDERYGYDDERYYDGRYHDGRYYDDRYDVRYDDRDRIGPYDETHRASTNDAVSAPRSHGSLDVPGSSDPTTSPAGGTQRRDLNPSPRDPYRYSGIP